MKNHVTPPVPSTENLKTSPLLPTAWAVGTLLYLAYLSARSLRPQTALAASSLKPTT